MHMYCNVTYGNVSLLLRRGPLTSLVLRPALEALVAGTVASGMMLLLCLSFADAQGAPDLSGAATCSGGLGHRRADCAPAVVCITLAVHVAVLLPCCNSITAKSAVVHLHLQGPPDLSGAAACP
jgi:hypothetical protein